MLRKREGLLLSRTFRNRARIERIEFRIELLEFVEALDAAVALTRPHNAAPQRPEEIAAYDQSESFLRAVKFDVERVNQFLRRTRARLGRKHKFTTVHAFAAAVSTIEQTPS